MSYILPIDALPPDVKRLFDEGTLARDAIQFMPHDHAVGYSIFLGLFFSLVGVLGLRQAVETYERTGRSMTYLIAGLSLVGLFVGSKHGVEAYRGVVSKVREKRGLRHSTRREGARGEAGKEESHGR